MSICRILFAIWGACTFLGWGNWVFGQAASYAYSLEWLTPHTHTYVITLETETSGEGFTDVRLPAWRPGRYILQDYAAAVTHFEAMDISGKSLSWQKVDRQTWRVSHPTQQAKFKVVYRYLANNRDAGSSYVDEDEVYFNPVNLFMYVPDRMYAPVKLTLPTLDPDWKQATSLLKGKAFNQFSAPSYHDFADAPSVFSPNMKQLSFEDEGVPFYLHFQGKYEVAEEEDPQVIDAVRRICQEQASIFGGYPFDRYHFIYRLLPGDIRHAVEHKFSASFALPDRIATNAATLIRNMRGITAHEFWHAWNVKRIRPAAMWPYDYSKEAYTRLHWFTEGVTDYYDQLSLVRSGLTTEEQFLSGIARTIQALENDYAATLVSPAASSFNSWLATSPYRNPDTRISYYTLGSRLGMAIDLTLRQQTKQKKGLDDVFRYLYTTYYEKDQGVPEDGVQKALESISGKRWDDFFAKYVHGTAAYDYKALFKEFGLTLIDSLPAEPGLRGLGIISSDNLNQGLYIRKLHPHGDAFKAGLANGDLILDINGQATNRLEPATLINDAKIGDTFACRVYRSQTFLTVVIPYEQAFVPKYYRIERNTEKRKAAAAFAKWTATQTQ